MKMADIMGVKYGELFLVRDCFGTFKLMRSHAKNEVLLWKRDREHEWEEASADFVLRIISVSPDNIVHMPTIFPTLTGEQRAKLKALKALGYLYLAKDQDCDVYAYIGMPTRSVSIWTGGWDDPRHKVCDGLPERCLIGLVSWDGDPLYITDALRGAK